MCQICAKRGHNALICWYITDLVNFPEQPSQHFQAHLAQPSPPGFQANNAQTATFSTEPEWYLDSGATHHVTNDLNNLSSYLPYEGFDSLHIGACKLLQDNSIFIEFLSFPCVIKDRHTVKVLLQIKLIKGLHILPPQIKPSSHAFYGARVSADVWHLGLDIPLPPLQQKI